MITMGLMAMLKREVQDVAFFKPLVSSGEDDTDIQFITQYFKLKQAPETAYGMTIKEAKILLAKEQNQTLYEKILERYTLLLSEYDFVLCQGIHDTHDDILIDASFNFNIAKNLQIPVLEIVNGHTLQTIEEAKTTIEYTKHAASRYSIPLLGIFFNRVPPEMLSIFKQENSDPLCLFVLPEIPELNQPTMADIVSQTGARLLTKDRSMLERTVIDSKIAAMMLEHYLDYIEEGDLIIVPADRSDILVGTFLANLSHNYPSLAGILLTGDTLPARSIDTLIRGTDIPILPIIALNTDTQSAAFKVENVSAEITLHSERKIALALGLFHDHVDMEILKKRISLAAPRTMTPVRFTYMLYEKARAIKSRILLPESTDERILRAADNVLRRGLCDITLLGNPQSIRQRCSLLGLDLSKAEIVDIDSWEHMERFVDTFYELRKHKGIIREMARDMMSRTNYFATMMLYLGYVDGIVSGATHTTRETIKPAFEIIKTEDDIALISSLFFMLLDDRVLVYADCAVNPDPDAEQLAHIAISSAKTAKTFGIEPRVAMLSYSSGDSGVGADVDKVRQATHIARTLAPDIMIEGPMQYDAAIDPKVAAQKMPESKVAGNATVFIFPDLNTGNNTYKAVQRSADAIAIGPILQGLKKPVNDLSRGAELADIIHTIAITAIQAAEGKRTS
jgi:phosphate acetyltransferase